MNCREYSSRRNYAVAIAISLATIAVGIPSALAAFRTFLNPPSKSMAECVTINSIFDTISLNSKTTACDIVDDTLLGPIYLCGDGASMRMKVDSQNRLWQYTDGNTMQYLKASFLESKVPGFIKGSPTSLRVKYGEKRIAVFHHYEGGQNWMGPVPKSVAKPGDEITLFVEVLTRTEFVKSIPRVTFGNEYGMRWMSNTAELRTFTLNSNELAIEVVQDPPIAGFSEFIIKGYPATRLGFRRGHTTLDVGITDAFGRPRFLRIYFDGFGPPSLGISKGTRFAPISFLAFDGTRLSLPYTPSEGRTQVATIYLTDPSLLYWLGGMRDFSQPYHVPTCSRSFMLDNVVLVRELETSMGTPRKPVRLGTDWHRNCIQHREGKAGFQRDSDEGACPSRH